MDQPGTTPPTIETPAPSTPGAPAADVEEVAATPDTPGENAASPSSEEQLQRELDEALGGQDVDALMEQSAADAAPTRPRSEEGGDAAEGGGDAAKAGSHRGGGGGGRGGRQQPPEIRHELRRGRIAAVRGEDVFVDLMGAADTAGMQGIVPLIQFERPPRIGSIMDLALERVDEKEGLVYLSREGAVSQTTWDQLQRGAVVEARVTKHNKGGLELEMTGGIRAFMPASQIDLHPVGDLEPFVGQKLEASVQEIDRRSKRVLLSRRQHLQNRREAQREKTLATLEEGQLIDGVVSNVTDFGAFVDIGGVDGLVHVSDMCYTHVTNPSEVLKNGQQVRVKVLKIELDKHRIALGLKQTEPDPWDSLQARLQPGQQVTGKVVKTLDFGAFIELEQGVEGLLPIGEVSWQRINRVEEVIKTGDQVRVQVLQIDPERRRLTLSLKQAGEGGADPWAGAEKKYSRDQSVEGTVLTLTDFGAFVELEPGIEGLVHISELADRRVDRVEDVVKSGDVKMFRILEVNEDERRVRLSMREQREAAGDRGKRGDTRGAAPSEPVPPRPARKRAANLRGGMDVGGIGLGNLKLEDL